MQIVFYNIVKNNQVKNNMKFTIPCKTFIRLAKTISYFRPNLDKEIVDKINCIRLENYKGNCIAIVSNSNIACIERTFENTTEPDGHVHIKLDDNLLKQCEIEAGYDGFLTIEYFPELSITTIQSNFGYVYNGDPALYVQDTPLDNWKEWYSESTPEKDIGPMYWELIHINLLFQSSPSGKIIFQENIDRDKPIILNDIKDENWLGLFIPKEASSEKPLEPAILHEWVK